MRSVSRIFFAVLLTALGLHAEVQNADEYGKEALAAFESKLQSLPTDHNLGMVSHLCQSLPVRELTPGQVGQGYPGERDTKFKCMLQFLVVMDGLSKDDLPVAYTNVSAPGVAISGMDPNGVKDPVVRAKYIAAIKANNAVIEQYNFQRSLQETRRKYARFLIPNFLKYDYPAAEKNQHLQDIIREGLQSDPKAIDLTTSLLKQLNS